MTLEFFLKNKDIFSIEMMSATKFAESKSYFAYMLENEDD